MLRKNGISALLTRSTDVYVPLIKRSQLAAQLKADFFVSVHVNSHTIPNSKISGIETFYLNGNKFIPPHCDGGFLFINTNKSSKHIKIIQNMMHNNVAASQYLADNIQKQLITILNNKNYHTKCRGTKKSRDRVLLRSPVPAVLVEVGFITNKKEAVLLSNKHYQSNIAKGIYSGIKNTLKLIK